MAPCSSVVQSLTDFATVLQEHWPNTASNAVSSLDGELEILTSAWKDVQSVLTLTLAELRVERNKTVAKASNLPTDLLHTISQSLRDDHKAILGISHTCSRWRNAILQDPLAWTHIDTAFPSDELAGLFAERSCALPLNIAYAIETTDDPDPSAAWISRFCEREVRRIGQLRCSISCPIGELANRPDFSWMTNHCAPELTKLSLSFDESMGGNYIIDRIFLQSMPKLRSLSLSGIRLPWTPGMYRGLTKLRIELRRRGLDNISISDSSVLTIFPDSPCLEELFLSILFKTRSNYLSAGDGPLFPLPHLKKATFVLTAQDMTYILSSISLSHKLLSLHLRVPGAPEEIAHCLPSNPRCIPIMSSLSHLELMSSGGAGSIRIRKSPSHDPTIILTCFIGTWFEQAHLSSVLEHVHRLGCCSPFPVIALSGQGDATRDTQALISLTHVELPSNRLRIDRCASDVVGKLGGILAERKLNILQFSDMRIEASSLLHLSAALYGHLKMLWLARCTLLASDEETIRRILGSIRALFNLQKNSFVGLSFLTPSMIDPLPLLDP